MISDLNINNIWPIPSGGASWDAGSKYLKSNIYNVIPEDGMLVLFPSYLMHSALPYRGKTDRIVIAFNSKIEDRS